MAPNNPPRRGRTARALSRATVAEDTAVWPGVVGGWYKPLTDEQIAQIELSVRHVLSSIGMNGGSQALRERLIKAGATETSTNRLVLQTALIDEALPSLNRSFTYFGRNSKHDMDLRGHRVHTGTGGASPMMIDLETGDYRASTLADLYDCARLCDQLENVHFFSRPVVATDMPDDFSLDVNTAFACLKGTSKHVFVSASQVENVEAIAELAYLVAGSQKAFKAKPFLSLNSNFVVPPLRLADEACDVMARAVELGIPINVNSFDQSGASSPVTLAGSVVQTTAEVLFGMIICWLVDPKAKCVFGARPMVTDLRTGALSGGGGEQAVMMAAVTQMAKHFDLPCSTIAGATDSKDLDAQSGYEKGMSVTLAAQAGCNLITQACGVRAGLMATSLESYVIDNDMLGGILRATRGIEISDETMAVQTIANTVSGGDGHFLGDPSTLALMQSEYAYPHIANRQSVQEWQDAGTPKLADAARDRVRSLLSNPVTQNLDPDVEEEIRARFDIKLETHSNQNSGSMI